MQKYHRAFTLIELSIVLVVIGLIVGGVLTGRDLIYASRIRKMGTELQQINTAITTFRTRYDCLPGDCQNMTSYFGVNSNPCPNGGGATGTCDGNGDGFINGWGGAGATENFYAWQQLAMSKLIAWSYTPSAVIGGPPNPVIQIGKNVPASSFNPGIGYNFFSARATLPTTPFLKTIEIGSVDGTYSDVLAGAGLTGPQASTLDMKFDDGNPQSGKIYAVSGGSTIATLTTIPTQPSSINGNTTCVSGGSYLTSPSSGCTMEYIPDIP